LSLGDTVYEAFGVDEPVADRARVELTLYLWQELQRPSAGRMRVDEEEMGALGIDPVTLCWL
jgi:hypothetical protein